MLDAVALTIDLPEYNLKHGHAGTVVELLQNANAFEVEFRDRAGRTIESVGFRADQILVLHYDRALPPAEAA